jgi:hypothetical protein
MPEFVTLSMETKLPAETMEAVLSELRDVQAVKSARPLEQRALDPQSIMALVEVASGVLGAATSAWTLIDKIRKALHSRKVMGAHLTIPNGMRVDIDQIDEEQLGQLIGGASKDGETTK